ncbi:MAG: PilZ domain-containing protein [Phycisphaerales bacterium JB039]
MTATAQLPDRRVATRYTLPAGYIPVTVRALDGRGEHRLGHAYNISVSGLRFELDEPVAPGERIAIRIGMPSPGGGVESALYAIATVVWLIDDAEEPGPVRIGARFDGFPRAGDQERLIGMLSGGRYAIAA